MRLVLAYYYNVATLGTLMPGFLNLSGVPSVSTKLTASSKHASKLNRFGER